MDKNGQKQDKDTDVRKKEILKGDLEELQWGGEGGKVREKS